jgi:4-amino-4-deoxy-L-arabinose transferase-like glycosyltransferase
MWRSPEGQPPWVRPALLGIAAVAALLYAWNITEAGLAPFYSVAVKSMSESWKAFFYGAFDPRATITIDKLAGSFLPQALSARVFGFHPWSLALPQVIEGVISVLVMYRVVRRWAGVAPGLLAAAIFTLTPIAASMFGHSMEDGALTMCLVLAADAYQRAVMEARLRSLLWAGVWVGLGFQAKMLQAWMILPALALGYLVAAPVRLRRRLWQLGVAGVVTLAVSLSWIALYTFTPAKDRPYVDGSNNNSAVAMVFGYNGLERFGIKVPGAVNSGIGAVFTGGGRSGRGGTGGFPSATGAPAGGGKGQPSAGIPGGTGAPAGGSSSGHGGTADGASSGGLPGASSGGFGTGWTKLLGSGYAPEIGWLYPLAVLALIFGLVWRYRARRTDQVRAGFVMWGLWLLTVGLVFSKMSSIPHTAYMASLAPPLAALPGAGIVMFWRTYRAGDQRGWMLPTAIAAELAWALFVWRDYGGFLPWARTALVVAGVAAIVVLVAAKLSRRARARAVTAGLTVGVVTMLAAPASWAASVLDTKYAGTSFNASAGPDGGMGSRDAPAGGRALAIGQTTPPGGQSLARLAERYGFQPPGGGGLSRSGPGGGFLDATASLTASERALYSYVTAHRARASYLMAVQSWSEASPYILTTGQEVLPMGGFSGSVPEPTLAKVKELVRTGQLRFFLLDGGSGDGFGSGSGSGGSTSAAIASWAEKSCTKVPARDYGGTSAARSDSGSSSGGFGGGTGTLYKCQANT